MNILQSELLRRKQIKLALQILYEELDNVEATIKANCAHKNTKVNKIYHQGDYYNMSWVELQDTCLDCEKILKVSEDTSYKGYYG